MGVPLLPPPHLTIPAATTAVAIGRSPTVVVVTVVVDVIFTVGGGSDGDGSGGDNGRGGGGGGAATTGTVDASSAVRQRGRCGRHGPRAAAVAATVAPTHSAVNGHATGAAASRTGCVAAATPVAAAAIGRAKRHVGGPPVAAADAVAVAVAIAAAAAALG